MHARVFLAFVLAQTWACRLSRFSLEVGLQQQLAVDAGMDAEGIAARCVLAAPTGCASFQMKHGAATIHRAFGVPIGFCGPVRDKTSSQFLKRQQRLQKSVLMIFDEFSMIGRQMAGKIVYKVAEYLGTMETDFGRAVTLGGRDVILAGDPRQACPIGEALGIV